MTRRRLLALVPGTFLTSLGIAQADQAKPAVYVGFPSQDLNRVRAVVGAAHTNLETVKKLVGESPALAKSAVDWGYGDWETALGAASHTGRREIAEFLVANGARPDIFFFAMMGRLEAVKAMISATPELASMPGPHGISLLAHAVSGGPEAEPVVAFLKTLPGTGGSTAPTMTDQEKEVYIGRYSYGTGADDFVEAYRHSQGFLMLRRGSVGSGSRLNKTGPHEFAPSGAPAVRIRFTVEGLKATSVSIHDSVVILTARK